MKPPLVVLAGLAVAFAIAGCTLGTPATPSPTFPRVCCGPPTPTATSTTAPTAMASHAPTASPTVPPISVPTPGSTGVTACATDLAGEPDVPPPAKVTASDGSLVLGAVGSYTFCGTSADALPPRSKDLPTAGLGSPSTVAIQMLGGWGITGHRAGMVCCGMARRRDRLEQRYLHGTGHRDQLCWPAQRRLDARRPLAFPADGNATYTGT